MEKLKITLDPQHQISTILLDNIQINLLGPGYNDHNVHSLISFNKALRVIEEIGEKEHTNDWDPYFEIGLIDGRQEYSESGFWSLEITGETDDNGDQVEIENYIWDEERDEEVQNYIRLSVNEIEYIKVLR